MRRLRDVELGLGGPETSMIEGIEPGARVRVHELDLGDDVRIGAGATLVGDRVELGDHVRIAGGADIRAGEIVLGTRTEWGAASALVADALTLGVASRVSSGCELTCRAFDAGRLLFLADRVVVGGGGTTQSGSVVRMGDRCAINPRSLLNASEAIVFGDDVGTGADVTIWTHGFHFGHSPLDGFSPVFQPVRIERNVWLGFHVTVLPGVTIGANTIVAAGAVVVSDLEANVLAAGVPAKAKTALSPSPPTTATLQVMIEGMIEEWVVELQWKGARIERSGKNRFSVSNVPGLQPGEPHDVHFLTTTDVPESLALGNWTVIALDDLPVLRSAVTPGTALLELRSRRFTGTHSGVSADLRDFLRRHALPCGDEHCFAAIDPAGFARLRTAVPDDV